MTFEGILAARNSRSLLGSGRRQHRPAFSWNAFPSRFIISRCSIVILMTHRTNAFCAIPGLVVARLAILLKSLRGGQSRKRRFMEADLRCEQAEVVAITSSAYNTKYG
jgi:hypothetical protein